MPLAPLFALALLMADPAPAPAGLHDEPIPAGASADDYGLVSWCTGALTGHMTLYTLVKPTLDALPDDRPKETAALDAEQTKAGREYLALYQQATKAAEKASPRPIAERGLAMRRAGYSIWAAARGTSDSKARMWTWLGWELPGRCETAAERLYEKSLLNAQALGIDLIGGSSAASQKPVTPQINAAPPKDARIKAGASAKRQAQTNAQDTTSATDVASVADLTSATGKTNKTSVTGATDVTSTTDTTSATDVTSKTGVTNSTSASDVTGATGAARPGPTAAKGKPKVLLLPPPPPPPPPPIEEQIEAEIQGRTAPPPTQTVIASQTAAASTSQQTTAPGTPFASDAQQQGLPLRTAPPAPDPAQPTPAEPGAGQPVNTQPAGSGPGV